MASAAAASSSSSSSSDWTWCICLKHQPFHTESCLFLLNQISEWLASSQRERPSQVDETSLLQAYSLEEQNEGCPTKQDESDCEQEDSCLSPHGSEDEESEEKQSQWISRLQRMD